MCSVVLMAFLFIECRIVVMYFLSSFSKMKKDGLRLENLDLCKWYLASKTSRLMMLYSQHKHESAYAEDTFVTCLFVSVCLAVLSFQFKVSHCPFKIFQKMMCIELYWLDSYKIVSYRWMPCIVSYRIVSIALFHVMSNMKQFPVWPHGGLVASLLRTPEEFCRCHSNRM